MLPCRGARVRARGRRAGGAAARCRRDVPVGDRQADGRSRPARHSVAQVARRLGARSDVVHHRDPRAGEGRRLALDHDLGPHHARHVADRELRHRRAARALRAAARVGSRARRLRAHRGERGERRGRHAHDRREQGRRLRPERVEALHHARGRGRGVRRHRGHQSTGGKQGDQRVHPHEGEQRSRRGR